MANTEPIKTSEYITDLESMSEEEYRALKAAEKAEAEEWLRAINESTEPTFLHKRNRLVYDLKHMFEDSVELFGDKPLFMQIMKGDKEYSTISFKQAMLHIQSLGTKLIDMGLKGAHIGVIGPNCYEWVESYNAVIGGVGVVVPLDKELNTEEIANLCREGEIKAVICCSDKHYKRLLDVKRSGDTNLEIVITTSSEKHDDPEQGLYSWYQLRDEGLKLVRAGDRRWIDARICNKDLAIILFTSGTTGVAKGVMHNHRAIAFSLMADNVYIGINENDIMFSSLPLHHTYEGSCTMVESMHLGSAIAFNRGLKYLLKDIQLSQPTVMLSVPLVFEKFYNQIMKTLAKENKDKALKTIFKLNKVTSKIGINIARKPCEQIMAQFGGKIRMFVAGGAKVDSDVLDFFRSLGVMTIQGYGLTETSPIVALNPDDWQYNRTNSAGRSIPLTEFKVVEPDENGNGEICVRGPQVMMGYYNNPAATEECMEDGWFHTGDLGHIDERGFVYITGRKKNVIIASNGKNVFPEELEEKALHSKYINECMVWADESGEETGHKGIYITLRVDQENVNEALGETHSDEEVYKLIDKEISVVNATMPDWKMIRYIRIRKHDFNKTTAMKIRRFIGENKLGD